MFGQSSRGRERHCIWRRGRPDLRTRKRGRFRLRRCFTVGPPLFLGRVFGVLFGSPACGCRFGSEPGRFWVGVCRPWFCPWLCSVSVGSYSKKKRAPTPKPAVICDHFLTGIPSCSMFWVFGSLYQKQRVGGTLGCVLRDGFDGWRSPVPRGVNTGSEVLYFLRQPSLPGPPTGPEHTDACWCGQCTRWRASRGVSCCCSAWSLPYPDSGSGEVHTSQWPRASLSSSHMGGMSGHSLKTSVVLCCACWWLSLVWLGAGASGGCLCFSLACGFQVVSSLVEQERAPTQ